jgi:hypothetical protein
MDQAFIMAGVKGAAILSLAAAASFAGAQQVGVYLGTTTDGHSVEIDVAQDPDTLALYVSNVNAGYTMTCPKTGDTQEWGVQWQGNLGDIIEGSMSANLMGIEAYTNVTAIFGNANHVHGKLKSGVPEYANSETVTQSCNAMNQGYTATFSPGGASVRVVPPGTRERVLHADRGVVR